MKSLKLTILFLICFSLPGFAEVSWNFRRIFKLKNNLIKRFINDNKSIINQSDSDRETLLYNAIYYDNYDIVEFLLKSGAKVERVDKCLLNSLSSAIVGGKLRIFNLIMRHENFPIINEDTGMTYLSEAMIGYSGFFRGKVEIIKELAAITPVDQAEFSKIKGYFFNFRKKALGLRKVKIQKEWKEFLQKTGLRVNVH